MTDAESNPLNEFVNEMAEEAGEGGRPVTAIIEMDGTIYCGGDEVSGEEMRRRMDEGPPPPPGTIRIIDFRTQEQIGDFYD